MLNKIMLIGNLGRDPEMSYTPAGQAITKFSVASTRRWNDKQSGEKHEETTWFSVVAFDKQAELASQLLHKGSKAYVEGRMQSRKYTDRQNVERTVWEVRLEQFEVLDAKDANGARPAAAGAAQGGNSGGEYEDDGIPF